MLSRDYHIVWEIELVATSPEDAARQALAIQRDSASLATVFDVFDEDGQSVRVDLLEERPQEAAEVRAAPE